MTTVLITGSAGFLGSHLCDHYLDNGDMVVGVDNLSTGRKQNIEHLLGNPNFTFIEHDICLPLPAELSIINYQLIINVACPASPPQYQRLAKETLRVNSLGVEQLIDLALKNDCRLVHSSTSEVYGDPEVHPQPESYWGRVNSYGPRAMYDEGKRFAEALLWVAQNLPDRQADPQDGSKPLNAGIVRIFNTYGPRMDPNDGRVVSNLIVQALKNEPLTLYGDGSQTRSFCYVSDLINGISKLAESTEQTPINIGNPGEFTVKELANKIILLTDSKSEIVNVEPQQDDPKQRQPDISKAKQILGWEPTVQLEEGLKKTIDYFRTQV